MSNIKSDDEKIILQNEDSDILKISPTKKAKVASKRPSSLTKLKIGKRKRKDTSTQNAPQSLPSTSSIAIDSYSLKYSSTGKQKDEFEDDKLSLSSFHPDYPNPIGHYQKHLHNRQKLDQENIYFPLLPLTNTPHIIGGLRDLIQTKKQCNCKRSYCLKLYCECFASGVYCDPNNCHCTLCKNREYTDNSGNYDPNEERANAVYLTLERNPSAFRPRALSVAGGGIVAAWNQNSTLIASNMNSNTKSVNQKVGSASESNVDADPSNTNIVKNINTSLQKSKTNTKSNDDTIDSMKSSPTKRSSNITTNSTTNSNNIRGCNCRKSFCLKKYCECFQAAVYCSPPICRCTDCQNVFGNEKREKLIAARRDKEALNAAAAAAVVAKEGGIGIRNHSSNFNHPQHILPSHHNLHAPSSSHIVVGGSSGSSSGVGMGLSVATNKYLMMNAMRSGNAMRSVGGVMMMGDTGMAGLPPSTFAVPMKLENNSGTNYSRLHPTTSNPIMMPPIAFESVSHNPLRNNTTTNQSSYFSSNLESAGNIYNQAPIPPQSLHYQPPNYEVPYNIRRKPMAKETDLQRKWRRITESDLSFLERVRDEILTPENEKNDTTNKSPQTKRDDISAQTGSKIKNMLQRIENAVESARVHAIEKWEKECKLRERSIILDSTSQYKSVSTKQASSSFKKSQEKSNDADEVDTNDDENNLSLLCQELLPQPKQTKLTAYAAKEICILEAQEAAMLQELACTIREEAYELSAERKQQRKQKQYATNLLHRNYNTPQNDAKTTKDTTRRKAPSIVPSFPSLSSNDPNLTLRMKKSKNVRGEDKKML